MKIFCFVQLFHISERGGGAEVQVNFLSQELVKRDYEVHYICQTVNKDKIHKTTELNGVIIHWLPQKSPTSSENFRNIKKLLTQINADYIIERMSSSYAWPIIKAKKLCKSKYVWICTDNESPVLFRTIKNYYKKKNVIKFLYASIKGLKIDLIRIYANKRADIAFTQNDFQKEQVKHNFNLESKRMISGHPIPENLISITQRFRNKTILWCANWGPHKQPELFIELASKMQHTDFKFVMIGGHGNKDYVEQLLLNKPKNLTTTGKLSFDDALAYFDTASVFVNTSAPGGDGFPNTFIQSWLRQTPVISLGFDPDNIITENTLGFKVSNVNETINCLENLFQNETEYKSMSNNVFNYAVENHSLKRMTDNFLSVLDNKQISNVK